MLLEDVEAHREVAAQPQKQGDGRALVLLHSGAVRFSNRRRSATAPVLRIIDNGCQDEYIKPDATDHGETRGRVTDDPDDKDAQEFSGGIDSADGDSTMHVAAPPSVTP